MLELDGNTGVSLLQDNTVSTTKIVDGTVTAAKLATPDAGTAGPQRMMLMAAKATTAGTVVDFSPAYGTGIPSWAKRITVSIAGVSTNGSSPVIIQLGTTSGVEVATYSGQCWYLNNASSSVVTTVSVGFGVSAHTGAADARSGIACVATAGSNTWAFSSTCGAGGTSSGGGGAGSKTLSGTLDRIRITTVNGTDTFDAGSVSLLIEG